MKEEKLTFKVQGWLDEHLFKELVSIADYLGREKNISIFKLNINKIINKGLDVDKVLEILDDVDAEYNNEEIVKALLKVTKKEVVFKLVNNKIVMKPNFYLGTLYDQLRNYLKYDRNTKLFYVKPMHFFTIKKVLESTGIKVVDETNIRNELKLSTVLSFKGELRPYQKEALERWIKNRFKGVIALPTGSGKTIIAIAALAHLNERTLIVTYTKEQMFQWGDLIRKFTDAPEALIGYFHSVEKKIKPITIITYQSAYKYIEKLSPHYSLLIIDECHHLPAEKFRFIAENSIAGKRMGLSATIYREDGKHELLFPLMGGIVYYRTPSELTELGYLAPYKVITKYVKLLPNERKKYLELKKKYREIIGYMPFEEVLKKAKEGDPNAIKALKVANALRLLIHKSESKVEEVKRIAEEELKKGNKLIVFTQYIDQAERIAKELKAYLLTGETDDRRRREILKRFKNIDKGVLVVTTVGDEGLDIPDANVGIIVAGSGSRRQFIQRLGRLLRPKEGKESKLYEVVVKGTAEELQSKKRKTIDLESEFTL